MDLQRFVSRSIRAGLPVACVLGMAGSSGCLSYSGSSTRAVETRDAYIVEGNSAAAARTAVEAVGGTVAGELGIIDGVAAELLPAQR
jgi:hypothetical protein